MKRVLVTGASGFIGTPVLPRLLERGFEVHALSRTAPDERYAPGITAHRADLLDAGQARRVLEAVRPTHLLHLAWNVEHGRFWDSEANYAWVGATLALLQAFSAAGGRRATLAGTCAEYDWSKGLCDETLTPTAPGTDYGACKNATRLLAEAWCRRSGISLAWGRIFHLYGPGEPAARLVPATITALARGVEARCTHGQQQRDFLYVADVASAFAALLDSAVEGAVNIASGQAVTLAGVVTEIARQMQHPELLRLGALPAPANDPPVLLATTRRLAEEVGWRPGVPLADGIRQSVEWWRAR